MKTYILNERTEEENLRYWDNIAQMNEWMDAGVITDSQYDELFKFAGDVRWNDLADQLVKEKGIKNENKSEDEKCTCPTHKLSQQGCPKLRGEPKCAE